MNERDLSDLEIEDSWDFDEAFVHPPSKTARAVVPVAFEREEFSRISAYARSHGITVTQCIHALVLRGIADIQSDVAVDSSDVTHDPLE